MNTRTEILENSKEVILLLAEEINQYDSLDYALLELLENHLAEFRKNDKVLIEVARKGVM